MSRTSCSSLTRLVNQHGAGIEKQSSQPWRSGAVLILALTLLLLSPRLAAGQGFTATIRGTITDQSGGVLRAVTITVKNTNKGWERTTTTDDSGDYVVTQLPADTYSIIAQLKGFKRELRDGVV